MYRYTRFRFDDDYFILGRIKLEGISKIWFNRSKVTFEEWVDFDEEDYNIYKLTGRQRYIGNEWRDFEYAGYIFFKKSLYDKEHIEQWLLKIKDLNINILYLGKPFPPIEYLEKIKVCDE
tara:strand:+ start:1014 stop:1373 length:360 start_codon:yes stop_codon:yes gene_type:complete